MVEPFASLAALESEHAAMESAPDHEIPRRAVPQSAEQHRKDQVDVGSPPASAISAERDVEVFPQPRGKRNVPAPPEVSDGFRSIGRIEILSEDEAEDETEPDRHVGVTAEIEVNLE